MSGLRRRVQNWRGSADHPWVFRRLVLFTAASGLALLVAGGPAGAATTPSVPIATAPPAAPLPAPPVPPAAPPATDFWLVTPAGQVEAYGEAKSLGSLPAAATSPIVAVTPTPDAGGYWLVAQDGDVFAFGDAGHFGSMAGTRLTQPIVGMAATVTGQGYWLVARDGGIFAFGDARFFGSTGAIVLNQPIVGMAPTQSGDGYWLVASDGGIFSFGDAAFHGSTGAIRLVQPIVAMAPTAADGGYYLLASDGGVFNFGAATFHGSTGGDPTPDPAEKIVPSEGDGYWIVDQNGTAHPFGDAGPRPPVQGLLFRPVTGGDRAVTFAFAQLGKPYVWGGNGPNGFDCSGLALASWQAGAGVGFARIAEDQYHTAGTPIPLSDLQAGDLVFWGSNAADWTSVYHAGMYVGGGRIVEATGDHVQLNSLGQWGLSDLMPHGMRPGRG